MSSSADQKVKRILENTVRKQQHQKFINELERREKFKAFGCTWLYHWDSKVRAWLKKNAGNLISGILATIIVILITSLF